MTVERTDILIVGAGLAGARCAEMLRAEGYDGRILVVGDEPHPPYERPALSKELLVGSRAAAELALRKPGFWAATRDRAPAGDAHRQHRRARPAEQSSVLRRSAGGSSSSRPASAPAGYPAWTLCPASTICAPSTKRRSLRDALAPGARLAIVGAGFVGLEVASSARALGLEVTVIEPATVPFERTLGAGGRLAPRRACPARRRRPAPGHAGRRRRARWRRRRRRGRAGRRHAAGLRRRPRRRRSTAERRARRRPVRPRAGRGRPDRRLRANGGRWRVRLRRRRKRRAPVSGRARAARALERRRGNCPGHRRRHPRPRAGTLARRRSSGRISSGGGSRRSATSTPRSV